MKKNLNTVFLVAGRTGGPFMPLVAIYKNLKSIDPIFVGVRGGFEDIYCKKNHQKLVYLPEAKLSSLSFKGSFVVKLWLVLEIITVVLKLLVSVVLSLWYLARFQPKIIVTTGSFLGVPVVFATNFVNIFIKNKIKVVVHQQDPQVGLANKLVAKFADVLSCTFDYTKEKYPQFRLAKIIPNPINTDILAITKTQALEKLHKNNHQLFDFITTSQKPIFLIFGGGSGALEINNWVTKNLLNLVKHFRVIHLTGVLQKQTSSKLQNPEYLAQTVLFEEMPLVLNLSNLVFCRAGVGSISELRYLNKPSILLPMKDSHQELNAKLAGDNFLILKNVQESLWLDTIKSSFFKNQAGDDSQNQRIKAKYEQDLQGYYDILNNLLD